MTSVFFATTDSVSVGTPIWAWLVPLILVGVAVAFVLVYYRNSTFHEALNEGIQSVLDAAPSQSAPSKSIIRKVSTDEYNNIIARMGALFTTRRYVPQSQATGLYVYQKQEAPRGCLMIFIHIIVALLLFALCIIPGIIYLVVIFSKGDKIRVASVQVAPLPEGYSFTIQAPGSIKRKIYQILAPFLAGAPGATAAGYAGVTGRVEPATIAYTPSAGIAHMATPAPPQEAAPIASSAPIQSPAASATQPEQINASLGPDEKECPYCAEVIKAKAVKCKHCGSDLR